MIYYKIVSQNNIIDVNTDEMITYFMFSSRSNCILSCGKNEEYLGIISSDHKDLYHLINAPTLPPQVVVKAEVEMVEITENEYLAYKQTIDEQREREQVEPIPNPEPPEPEPSEEEIRRREEYERSIQFVRDNKIQYLDYYCNQVIEAGVDVTLTDGITRHYSLAKEDQINLMERQAQINLGAEYVSYHADGELCTYYTAADMMKVITASIFHKMFHVTYFNSLREYVNSLETIEEIAAIEYGIEIPEEYQSQPLKDLYLQIEDNNNETSE